jgi:aspartyl-tRNA(Asn)/glutamyl-tRNA(Gln) amidotransferase subunit A
VLDGVPKARHKDMDPGFVRMAERGRRYTLGDYLAGFAKRAELANIMARFHQKYDLLLTPQMPTPALGVGLEAPAPGGFGDEWIEWSPFTYPFNLTQQPAASVPCGFTSDGLPIGLQIVGAARADALVLRAARAFESLAPFPTISAPRMHSDATTHA